MTPQKVILYAEDEENDVIFLKHAFKITGSPHRLQCVPDGQQVVEYFLGQGAFSDRKLHPLPCLVLLDINMPKKSGLEVLAWLRQQPRLKSMTAVILTSSSRQEDVDKACLLGADDFLLKPSEPRKLVDIVKSLHERWLSQPATVPLHR